MAHRNSFAGILAAAALGAALLIGCETSEPNKPQPTAVPAAPVDQPTSGPSPADTLPTVDPALPPGYPYPYPAAP